jgi:hypothetical protein
LGNSLQTKEDTTMGNSDPKSKQNSDKQDKPSDKQASTANKVPERPQPNVTAAQKSAGNPSDKSENKNDG